MAWTKYKEIKYALAGIPGENLSDFPKLISITADAEIAAELSGGGGIKFTSADGLTDLPFGLYPDTNLAAGTILARVKVDLSAAASVGDVIARLYYSATETTTEDKAGTVSNGYAVFMPLEEDPSGSAPQMRDWVTDTLLGTSVGSMTAGDLVAGQVGKGLDLDGTDDRIEVPNSASLENPAITVEIAAKLGAGGFANLAQMTGSTGSWTLVYFTSIEILRISWNGGVGIVDHIVTLVDSTFHAIAARVSAAGAALAVDGSIIASGAGTDVTYGGSPPLGIGAGPGSGGNPTTGVIDEFRLSSVARSNGWLAYAYTDDFDNANTFTLSAEQGGGGGIFTAALAATAGAATFSGSAEFDAPTFTGTLAATAGAATFSGIATLDAPVFTGALAATAAAPVFAGSATFDAPIFTGTLTATAAAASFAGSAEFDAPVYMGALTATAGGSVFFGSATFDESVSGGTMTLTSGATQFSGTATFVAADVFGRITTIAVTDRSMTTIAVTDRSITTIPVDIT